MSAHAADKERLFVDDVVTALTGTIQPSAEERDVFQDQMKRATEEFDLRTAEAFARALLEALCQEPIDPRRLEALLILGLAHPTILDRHRISLKKEGDRLAAMLNAQGQHDRARTLLDVIGNATSNEDAAAEATSVQRGNAGANAAPVAAPLPSPIERDHGRIEELLRQADTAASRGRTGQAILLLQEVVSLDRHRRDVARMIRDLRWQQQERRERSVRRLKFTAVLLVVGGAVAGLVWRENHVRQKYAAIPSARTGDIASLDQRRAGIDELLGQEYAWLGMTTALSERAGLERELADLRAIEAAKASEKVSLSVRATEIADAQRSRGMTLAQQGRFEDALVELRRALASGGDAWPARTEVQTNVNAIAEWIEKRPERQGTGR